MSWTACTLKLDSENDTKSREHFQAQISPAIQAIKAIRSVIQLEQLKQYNQKWSEQSKQYNQQYN